MRVFSSFDDITRDRPQVVVIGAFDGVHRGHQFLISRASEIARARAAGVTVVTFWPPPVVVLEPDKPVHFLTLRDEKIALLAQTQIVDQMVLLPFTHELSQLSAEAFLAQLRRHLDVIAFVEGDDFKLGHNREGTIAWLQQYGEHHDIVVESVARRDDGSQPISSTRIRHALEAGDVAVATDLLGHSYDLVGEVVHGDARGRTLGFPTANLRVDPLKLVPANGIYAVRAWRVGTPDIVWQGAASIGVRPVFDGRERVIEVYLLDVHPDLYGEALYVTFVQRLREERDFPSVEALVAQMEHDVAAARRALDH
ncbi:MAG TPA: bifunctional riboflavin kinase/FAD synthetase [Ktedonobacterales bacterium]|nr:bifunctional riboflavin kinase/FAD synthetase [Ktedonobacterales bacterium]